MKISIVTISFNQQEFLRECIESVLNQKGVDFEYIIVDAGSTDGSRAIIDEYKDKVIRVYEGDRGPADGLNKGFLRASGDVYGFINSDDYLLPGALAKIADFFLKSRSNIFVTGTGYLQFSNGERRKVYPSRLSVYRYLVGGCNVFQQGTWFPAKMFKDVGGFNLQNKSWWDGELFLRFMQEGYKHEKIDDEIAVFRVHPESITGSGEWTDIISEEKSVKFREIYNRTFFFRDRVASFFFRANKKCGAFFKAVIEWVCSSWR